MAWKRWMSVATEKMSLRAWCKEFGLEWLRTFETGLAEKHTNWETMVDQKGGAVTNKVSRLIILSQAI